MKMKYIPEVIGMFLIPLLVVLIPILLGQWYGKWNRKKSKNIQDAPVGVIVGSAFALLAFMLSITFQIAANRYESRKELLLDEVTNIRTSYLLADIIPEPLRSDTKKLLVEYVDLRADVARNYSRLESGMIRSQQILDSIWNSVKILSAQDRSSEMYALYSSSVNNLVDNYNQRITMTLEYRIPPAILKVLFFIAFLSMLALGYQFGMAGKGNFVINLLFAVIFAMVMFLILALDRPETGLAKLDQKPLFTLQRQLKGN